jgi:hypothetical protein
MMTALILTLLVGQPAAGRAWQTGKWADATISHGRANARAHAIDTEDFRYEVDETAAAGAPPLKTRVGAAVLFAVENDIVYIREGDGGERRLRLLKSTRKLKHYSGAGPGHFIRATGGGGQTITLEDGSVWEIDPRTQFKTAEWEPLAGITVHLTEEDPDFNYILNNTDVDDWSFAIIATSP